MGRCGECGEFGTYVEEVEQPGRTSGQAARAIAKPVSLAEAGSAETERIEIGIGELDRVLGGGLVPGSLVLLGGEPGIGKSTLLLQAADALGAGGIDVLYVCGEESPEQVGLRARRIGADSPRVSLLPELDIGAVEAVVEQTEPGAVVLDSIQTAFDSDLAGAAGSVGQVRACTARLMRIAKDRGITTLIVGHVTKEGAIAGPRVLEHMVDAVLYFEGDRDHSFRIVRAVKNRFGSSSEIGLFEMGEQGLVGVSSPGSVLLAERSHAIPGSAVMVAVEGSRPLLLEIQALVTPSYLPAPRRLATGIDSTRLLQVIAVLERHASMSFSGMDVHVSVAAGMRASEPAVDLPLALALASAHKGRPVRLDSAAFGELGLTGHVRAVPQVPGRVREAGRMGLQAVVGAYGQPVDAEGASLVRVSTVVEAIDKALV